MMMPNVELTKIEGHLLLAEFVWATEVNMATLEELENLKSSSLGRKDRQRVIVNKMLATCSRYKDALEVARWDRCHRVAEYLSTK